LSAAIASGELFKNTCSADELKELISGLNKTNKNKGETGI